MRIDWSFIRWIGLCYAVAGVLGSYPLSQFATPAVIRSVIAGTAMSLVNLLLGYLAIEGSFTKSNTTFLKYVLGGMVARLLLMWMVFLALIGLFGFHAASLMLTLLFFYLMNLALEIMYLQRRTAAKQ